MNDLVYKTSNWNLLEYFTESLVLGYWDFPARVGKSDHYIKASFDDMNFEIRLKCGPIYLR